MFGRIGRMAKHLWLMGAAIEKPVGDWPSATWIEKPFVQTPNGQTAFFSGPWAFQDANVYSLTPYSILCMEQMDARYVQIGGNGTAGVSSFNNRTGSVTLTSNDVVTALTFTPISGVPIASEFTLGGIKVGSNLSITSDGTLNATGGNSTSGVQTFDGRTGDVTLTTNDVVTALGFQPANATSLAQVAFTGSYSDLSNTPTPYALPTASATVLGGIKVGANLSINANGVLSATGGGTANGTYLDAVNLTYPLNMNATWTGACTTSPAQSGYGFMGTSYQPNGNGNHSVLLTATAKAVNMGSYVYINDYDPGNTQIKSWAQNGTFSLLTVGPADTTLTTAANRTWSDGSVLTRAYADSRYAQAGGSLANIPISAQPFLNATVQYSNANMPTWAGYMVAGQNAVNRWNNPNSPPSVISSFDQNVVSGIAYSTDGNSPQVRPGMRNVQNYYTYPNQVSKWYANWGDITLDSLKPTFSQRYEQYASDEKTIQGYSEGVVSVGSGGSGSSPVQLLSTQSTITSGTPVPYTVGLSVNGSCVLNNGNYASTSSVTLLGTSNLTWTGASVLTRDYADSRYGLKVSGLTGREPITTEVPVGDKFLQIENGLVVGWITAAERQAWIQETDELIGLMKELSGE